MTQHRKNLLSSLQPTTSAEFLQSFEGAAPAYTGEQSLALLILEGERWKASLPSRGIAISERAAKLERNPQRAAALAKARARLAGIAEERSAETLTTLRLKAGLSQAQLAQKVGTKQSNVSRWEREPKELQVTTILKLAAALGVSDAKIFELVKASVKELAVEV